MELWLQNLKWIWNELILWRLFIQNYLFCNYEGCDLNWGYRAGYKELRAVSLCNLLAEGLILEMDVWKVARIRLGKENHSLIIELLPWLQKGRDEESLAPPCEDNSKKTSINKSKWDTLPITKSASRLTMEASDLESVKCEILLVKLPKPVGCYSLLQDKDTKILAKSLLCHWWGLI